MAKSIADRKKRTAPRATLSDIVWVSRWAIGTFAISSPVNLRNSESQLFPRAQIQKASCTYILCFHTVSVCWIWGATEARTAGKISFGLILRSWVVERFLLDTIACVWIPVEQHRHADEEGLRTVARRAEIPLIVGLPTDIGDNNILWKNKFKECELMV